MNDTIFTIAVDRLQNLIRPLGWNIVKTEKVERGIEVIVSKPAKGHPGVTLRSEAARIQDLALAMGWESEGTEFSPTQVMVWLKYETPEIEEESEEIST